MYCLYAKVLVIDESLLLVMGQKCWQVPDSAYSDLVDGQIKNVHIFFKTHSYKIICWNLYLYQLLNIVFSHSYHYFLECCQMTLAPRIRMD